MKTYIALILFAGLTAGVFNSADAQRGRDNGGRGGRESNVSPQRESRGSFSETRNYRPSSSFSRNNSFTPVQRNNSRGLTPGSLTTNRGAYTQRNVVTRNDVNVSRNNYFTRTNPAVSSGFNRDRIYNSRYNSYNNNYRSNNYYYNSRYYGGGYYNYGNRRYSFMYGPRYSIIPRSFISIRFGGYPYYYNNGFYYGYYGGYYQPIFPPFGLQVGVLPYGYYSFDLGGYPYYYYNGIYYRDYDNSYEVVDAPMGASVYSLPQGAKAVVLNGEKLYELNGTYYKEDRDSKGQTIYTVVGKNGEVNNTTEGDDSNNTTDNGINNNIPPATYNNTPPATSPSFQLGDTTSQLPEGSKAVTINGEKMYVSPDDVYFKEGSDGGVVNYKVVGK